MMGRTKRLALFEVQDKEKIEILLEWHRGCSISAIALKHGYQTTIIRQIISGYAKTEAKKNG